VLPASVRAADFVRELSLFTGGFFTDDPPPRAQVRGARCCSRATRRRARCTARSTARRCTPRRFYAREDAGERFELKLGDYREVNGIAWATRLEATSDLGRVVVEQREVGINGELPAKRVRSPPSRGAATMTGRPRGPQLAGPRARVPGPPSGVTLAVAGVLTVLAVLGMLRLRPDTSLAAMFAKDDPAADAMVRVLDGFGAVEELLVLVTVPDVRRAHPRGRSRTGCWSSPSDSNTRSRRGPTSPRWSRQSPTGPTPTHESSSSRSSPPPGCSTSMAPASQRHASA
jgi:hypothetical protein